VGVSVGFHKEYLDKDMKTRFTAFRYGEGAGQTRFTHHQHRGGALERDIQVILDAGTGNGQLAPHLACTFIFKNIDLKATTPQPVQTVVESIISHVCEALNEAGAELLEEPVTTTFHFVPGESRTEGHFALSPKR
jgi:hypothetical protein